MSEENTHRRHYSGCVYQVKLFFKQFFLSVIVQSFSGKSIFVMLSNPVST